MRFLALALLLLTGCASVERNVVSDLAPTGKLRAAINFGNPVLASRDAAGKPKGVSVDLATELARRLGVPLEVVPFEAAGKVVEAGKANLWDIGFVALDPARAQDIAQSPPYVVIEGAYLVRSGSEIRNNSEVDRPGNRVVVGPRSAYDLYLQRNLKQAKIVHAPSSPEVVSYFLNNNMEVAAGVKQQLEADAKKNPGVRILPGRFMVINQAMASQRNKPAGAKYVREFIEEMKASGFVAKALERHGIQGAGVAPAGDAAAN
ncbi:MAG TPA: ABC transporter substrate-binding protein [Burkholderiales bacterium]|nr:ABC transporter substrate-binding protein [Burkholderiales bacterium]